MFIQAKISIKMKLNLQPKEIMKSTKIIFYTTMIIAMIIGNLFSAVITILPADVVGFGSQKLSILGYVAHCSFTPWSTLISLALTGLGIFFLVRLIKYLKTNNISFVDLMKMYAIAFGVLVFVSTCFPFVLFLVGVYLLIYLINYFKPRFKEKLVTEADTKN